MQKNIPTVLIILGATGDLVSKKIIPALFHLWQKQKLPKLFKIIGFSRQNLSHTEFRDRVKGIVQVNTPVFLDLFFYQQGLFDSKADYQKLQKVLGQTDSDWKVCSNKLFYLAVPPKLYETIFNNLSSSGLTDPCSDETGWTRLLVEKPFGKDAKTAEKLDATLGRLFREVQIYRIDHYLGKEMIQNILAFRFSNNIFEKVWNSQFIESVHIRLWENLGVENRGAFYDGLGALRDVGQNHLLQMLALVTMDEITEFKPDPIRNKRAEILKTLAIPSKHQVGKNTFRAQYQGYREIKEVNSNSQTETYFKIIGWLNHLSWKTVPVIMESGKRLGENRKEIEVVFRHTSPCLCPAGGEHQKDKVVFTLEPEEGIRIEFWSKKPGFEFEVERRSFDFTLRPKSGRQQYTEEYEKLLLDAISGDQTLFVSTQEVAAMWRFIDPIVNGWQANLAPLEIYKPDSSDISKKELAAGAGFKKEIGIIGLGKMGGNLARRLLDIGWAVSGFNRTIKEAEKFSRYGLQIAGSIEDLAGKLTKPRIVWLMVPAGKAVNEVLFRLIKVLDKGDTIIDGGNSYYKDSVKRHRKLKQLGFNFLDVGVSGGPSGALAGPVLMIGGERQDFEAIEPLFSELAGASGYKFFEGPGAGHFVKMAHNGIEYGMMQALAEGFTVLKNSTYKLSLTDAAEVYNQGSVIESRLVGWLKNALELHGEDLKAVPGTVGHTGEGEWTAKTAREMKVKAKIIEESFKFRLQSEKKSSFTGKILSALREQFGGHKI